jgi:excisionase family DNA binding protein
LGHTTTATPELAMPVHAPQPLAVAPREASRLLSIGESKLYELLRAGELASFHIGNARRISTQSIVDYVARRLAAGPKNDALDSASLPMCERANAIEERAVVS